MAEDDGFISRWSRRKVRAKQGVPAQAEVPPADDVVPRADGAVARTDAVAPKAPPVLAQVPAVPKAVAAPAATEQPSGLPGAASAAPPPTLDDVAALTKESDYSRFVGRDVDPGVKNAAMKKLFASDPHFNVMDGLDVYIDDYNRFEPVPRNLLRQLVNARAMGFLDDELPEQPDPHNPSIPHENADLQLQPNDAPGQPGVERGVAGGADRPEGPAPDPVPPRSA